MQLQYRPWSGMPRAAVWSIWPIARVALGLLLRRRLFWILYACALLVFLMFFFGSLLFDWAQNYLLGNDFSIRIGRLNVDSAKALEFVRQTLRVLGGTRETYQTFFGYQGPMTMIVLCLSGSVLVGSDFSQRGVPFYLAKPIEPWHYLAGKFLAIAVVVNLISTVPALVLYAQQTTNDWNYLLDVDYFRASANPSKSPAGWEMLLGILAYGSLLTVVLGLLVLTTGAYVQRTMPLILVWASLFLFARGLARTLVDDLRSNVHWRLIDLWNSLTLLGSALLGFEHDEINPEPQPSFAAAACVLGGVCVLCLILLRRRMSRLEVVRSS